MIQKKLIHIFMLILILMPMTTQATDVFDRFNDGNAAYSVGDYDTAITIYNDLLKQDGNGVGLLYNLANSYAQKGQVGLAILNYERALRINASDSDVIGNLAKVRKDSGLFTEEPDKVNQILSMLSIDSWTIAAFVCLLCMVILLSVRLKYKSSKRSYIGSWVSVTLVMILSVTAVVYNYQTYNPLVVIAEDVKLQVSPFEGASSSGAIVQGRMLFPIKNHGDYTYVTDRAGRKGWLRSDLVEAVYGQSS